MTSAPAERSSAASNQLIPLTDVPQKNPAPDALPRIRNAPASNSIFREIRLPLRAQIRGGVAGQITPARASKHWAVSYAQVSRGGVPGRQATTHPHGGQDQRAGGIAMRDARDRYGPAEASYLGHRSVGRAADGYGMFLL